MIPFFSSFSSSICLPMCLELLNRQNCGPSRSKGTSPCGDCNTSKERNTGTFSRRIAMVLGSTFHAGEEFLPNSVTKQELFEGISVDLMQESDTIKPPCFYKMDLAK